MQTAGRLRGVLGEVLGRALIICGFGRRSVMIVMVDWVWAGIEVGVRMGVGGSVGLYVI